VLSPRARKLTLSLHLTVSVGWIGAVLAYLGLGLTAVRSDEIEQIRGMWSAMDAVGWYVIVPLAGASLVTGVIMALGTKWGLFRHYWVVISFVLTSLSVLILPHANRDLDRRLRTDGRPDRVRGSRRRPRAPRHRPLGPARDPDAQHLQAGRLNALRMAQATSGSIDPAANGLER
jgi:hypothetical protein